MIIPSETIPQAGNATSKPDEKRKTAPVRYASSTGYELSHSAPGNGNSRRERRKEERRVENKPVLLDTRALRTDRRKAAAPRINVEI
jgi:hypothetical protein